MPDARLHAALAPLFAEARDARTTPGAQVAVSVGDRLWTACFGALDYDGDDRVTASTRYDLASVTKPFTALAAARLARRGVLSLDEPLADLDDASRGGLQGALQLDALLSHRSGLPAWVAGFAAMPDGSAPGSVEARGAVLAVLRAATPEPRDAALYSDVGYVLAGEAMARRVDLDVDAIVRREVLDPLELHGIARRGGGAAWADAGIAPTERCAWRGRVLRGEVHDENAWALGGVSGHAGLFGTASDVARLGRACLDALAGRSAWLDAESFAATTAARAGGSLRMGWDSVTPGASSSGTRFGPRAFGHLGFTGTSLWCDPDRDLVVALLTNRVHPTRESTGVRVLRPRVHDAIVAALGG